MRLSFKFAIVSTILILPLSANATGRHECATTDRAAWLTKAQLTQQLEVEGWSVRRMKEDGGCWEVYGTNPDGLRVEGYFHPVTGEPELISQRGRILFSTEGNE
jgi:hypothetical protein